ncbi:MAG: Glycogen synthase [candidate division WWE3 bacterium GW2011_GWE2_43_18]|uniref:Glycogen synthase n=1 Tax=candidate division WWE3 bacterium TaxID=2053526 RepID=A0A656PNC6_UNCKA|nr:glycogen synthase [candidate division WWE3 bacterium RAAC2_WWE3_1]KKS29254.1 MAG: Glycogen synthase [candidate division WWE3 bacterium GW2011_GWB1_42_117]KKS54547.1 MAG: Glycogen synthase [candidate division WWE3 bacterium GW2011_GWD2_42_34]KKT05312.1 MAG: Glycogen synthase [candidate division WWE3 bacterium GW2011_GWE2_43_18]KKT06527.1 MAG: Glycogen synthase [candidate division WWE3 bacterium GW2011_GWF2_43_18]KKT08238.1 MAG: Glycogen synthase [candidate division WWE3 bacterium GW2011_GWD1
MKVLLAASEVAPIIKIGGLGDVIGALPKALEKISVNVDVIAPFFPSAKTEGLQLYKSFDLHVPFANKNNVVEVFKTKLPNSNVDLYLLKNEEYFVAGGSSFFANNITETQMFAFFDKAVVEYVKSSLNTYGIVHCNDWHTGLVTTMLKDELGNERPRTLFTIHNLNYQGIGGPALLRDTGIVPGEHPLIDWDLADGDLNMMQQGVTSSDYINTVSPSYAKEILTREFGSGFDDILRSREGRLSGILNGIDYSAQPRGYDINSAEEGKKRAKKVLLERLKIAPEYKDTPVFSFIGRIDAFQKGLDILFEGLRELLKQDAVFILLGTGDKNWEKKLTELSQDKTISDKFSCNITFDIELANLMYAGSDFLVVPSKYEPCGLIQMIAMWYGTLPIVHDVGGLKDTVKNGETGFVFNRYSSQALLTSMKEALSVYRTEKMQKMIPASMKKDFGWEQSAVEYKKLYERILS